MAPSPLDASIVNSTSGLLAVLDLNEEQKGTQIMEEMDINQVQDVPDTPDRLVSRKDTIMEDIDKQRPSSAANDLGNFHLLDEGFSDRLRGRRKPITENRSSRKLYSHFCEDDSICDEDVQGSSSSISKNARLFRKMMTDKTSNKEIRHSTRHQHIDHVPSIRDSGGNDHLVERTKLDNDSSEVTGVLAPDVKVQYGTRGKLIDLISVENVPYRSAKSTNGRNMKRKMIPGCTNFDTGKATFNVSSSRSFPSEDMDHILDLNAQNKCAGISERDSFHGTSKDISSEVLKQGSVAANHHSLHNIENSSKASSSSNKGKTKTEDTESGVGAVPNCGKEIDLSSGIQPKTDMPRSLHSIISPRNTGHRRLVRNGCISPYNIARAKQSAESHKKSSTNGKQDHIMKAVCDSPFNLIDIVSPDSESNLSDRLKGKRVINYSYPSKEHDAKEIYSLDRSSVNSINGSNGMADDCRDAFRCCEEGGGWRSTRNHPDKTYLSEEGYLPRRNDGVGHFPDQNHSNRTEISDNVGGRNNHHEIAVVEVQDSVSALDGHSSHMAQARSRVPSESERENGRRHWSNRLMNRHVKRGVAKSNPGECSTTTIDDSEIAYLGSSRETSNAGPTRSENPHHRASLKPVIEIDDMSPEISCNIFGDTSHMFHDDSDDRARQVEADEILARQLQEELYHELPAVGGGEIDANLAWTLQQEEASRLASSRGISHVPHPRDSTMSHLYRQYPQRAVQNNSVRSGNRARVTNSTRMARLRGSLRSRSPTMSSRGMNFQFPPNMDMDMRIHFLEALEAAVESSSEMNASHFQIQRDFNENDYEMLLALDEENHRHGGASLNQINGLPQSTVQADNLEEPCAICLEAPTIGDIIRHLPCLHKFHKDCIDLWLRRKTSCPVCKSSVT